MCCDDVYEWWSGCRGLIDNAVHAIKKVYMLAVARFNISISYEFGFVCVCLLWLLCLSLSYAVEKYFVLERNVARLKNNQTNLTVEQKYYV